MILGSGDELGACCSSCAGGNLGDEDPGIIVSGRDVRTAADAARVEEQTLVAEAYAVKASVPPGTFESFVLFHNTFHKWLKDLGEPGAFTLGAVSKYQAAQEYRRKIVDWRGYFSQFRAAGALPAGPGSRVDVKPPATPSNIPWKWIGIGAGVLVGSLAIGQVTKLASLIPRRR